MSLYSYSQPSSSECDVDLLRLEAEFGDDASNDNNVVAGGYSPQPECDEGIPKTCYCGSLPIVATAYTSKDPGRRYFSCENVEDGDCHIWKWWDVAVMEELTEFERRLRMLTDQGNDSDHKMVEIEKRLEDKRLEDKRLEDKRLEDKRLEDKKSWVTKAVPLLVSAMVFIFTVVMFKRLEDRANVLAKCLDEMRRLKMGVRDF